MNERRTLRWLAGMVALILVSGGGAAAALWVATGLLIEVDRFYRTPVGEQVVSDDVYRYWDTVNQNAYDLQSLVAPLLTGGIVALLALIAVLAWRWDVARGSEAEPGEGDSA